MGGRWRSPKASAGVADGECAYTDDGGGVDVGRWYRHVCVCVCAWFFCLEGGMEGQQCRRASSGHGERREMDGRNAPSLSNLGVFYSEGRLPRRFKLFARC